MLALLLPPMAVAGDVTFSAMPVVMLEPQPIAGPSIFDMLDQMRAMQAASVRRAPPANPCAQDLARLRCSDSACLKRSADDLEPACAAFLLGSPMPSPAPFPVAGLRGAPLPPRDGFFTVVRSGPEGKTARMSGSISGSMRAEVVDSLLPSALSSVMGGSSSPFDLLAQFMQEVAMVEAAAEREAAAARAEEEEEEEEAASTHPCAIEVTKCMQVAASDARDAIEGCLVRNFERLSPGCQCFVHQMTNGRVPPAPVTSEARLVSSKPMPEQAEVVVVFDEDGRSSSSMHAHPRHRLSCIFLLTSAMLVVFVLMRMIVSACSPPRPKHVVVVPPATATIRTASGTAKVATRAAPVQVAEPLAKA